MTRQTRRHAKRAGGNRRIPAKVPVNYRAPQDFHLTGLDPDHPWVCGEPDDRAPILVETTGMAFGLRKGKRRWVTGSWVEAGLTTGAFVQLADD